MLRSLIVVSAIAFSSAFTRRVAFSSAFTRRGALGGLRMSTSSSGPAKTYALQYEYVTDILERRAPFREAHLKLANDLCSQGALISGGPLGGKNGPVGALFLFAGIESAQSFVAQDPYVKEGLVPSHRISEWTVLIGESPKPRL